MCGRFVQSQPASAYAKYFDVGTVVTESLSPSYNVAPTDEIYAVAEHDAQCQLRSFRWGLLPWFAKERKMAARAINARVETVNEKATFRDSFERRRCLIPADGFYQWERKAKGRSCSTRPSRSSERWSRRRPASSERRSAPYQPTNNRATSRIPATVAVSIDNRTLEESLGSERVGLILIGAQSAADRLESDSDPGVFGGILVVEVAGGDGGDGDQLVDRG